MRLDLIRRLTPEGGNPLAEADGWLKAREGEASALARTIDTARRSGPPSLPMLAHLATVARNMLSV